MDCPVCSFKMNEGLCCTVCGYDRSADYERYPTLDCPDAPVASVQAKKEAYIEGEQLFRCPDCGGVSFRYLPKTNMLMCQNCLKKQSVLVKNSPELPEAATNSEMLEKIRNKLPNGVLTVNDAGVAAVTAAGGILTAGKPWIEDCTSAWTNVTSVALGWEHIVGLKFDGTVVASGEYAKIYEGVSDWKDIKMVAAGWRHTVGLMKNGRVVATGQNYQNQSNVEAWRNVVFLAANQFTTAGVTADGRVLLTGQLGNTCPWEDIVSVALGDSVLVGLRRDGRVLVQSEKAERFPEIIRWENIVAVAAGYFHVLGLKADGTVVAACAAGKEKTLACDVNGWRDIVAVAAGSLSSYGIRRDGTLVACGFGMDVRENKMPMSWKGLATEAVTVKDRTEAENPERQSEKYMALAKASLDANKKKQAYEWYVKAAELGNLDGQYNAGMCCMLGLGTEENPDKARMWLRKSAMQGNTMAQRALTKYFQ